MPGSKNANGPATETSNRGYVCTIYLGFRIGKGSEDGGAEDERDKRVALQGGGESRRQLGGFTPQGISMGWSRLPEATVHAMQNEIKDWQTTKPGLHQKKHHL